MKFCVAGVDETIRICRYLSDMETRIITVELSIQVIGDLLSDTKVGFGANARQFRYLAKYLPIYLHSIWFFRTRNQGTTSSNPDKVRLANRNLAFVVYAPVHKMCYCFYMHVSGVNCAFINTGPL